MSGVAILCSGQGKQTADMFDIVGGAPEAAPIFAAARRVLGGRDPRDLVRTASDDELHGNKVAQVLCCTQALASWAALSLAAPRPLIAAGYSAGELPAWAIAGVIGTETVLDLAVERAALMDAATDPDSGLAAVLGLRRGAIEAICQAHDLHIAIVNGPTHFLLGGRIADLEPALAEAERQGANRTLILPIAVASHTPVLREASERFDEVLRQRITATCMPPGVRLISGIDGAPVLRVADGRHKLARQIQQTVEWAACMDACRAGRPQRVLELGPGDGLARMFPRRGTRAPDAQRDRIPLAGRHPPVARRGSMRKAWCRYPG
ncbi:MAG: acyltransferase domain-containing protein [Rhodospirillales bacterium]